MAKLKVPEFGYRFYLLGGQKLRVHLAAAYRKTEVGWTACGFPLVRVAQVKLADVRAAEICQKCLGAIECTD